MVRTVPSVGLKDRKRQKILFFGPTGSTVESPILGFTVPPTGHFYILPWGIIRPRSVSLRQRLCIEDALCATAIVITMPTESNNDIVNDPKASGSKLQMFNMKRFKL